MAAFYSRTVTGHGLLKYSDDRFFFLAGASAKVNPPNNALRHSYASYWLARLELGEQAEKGNHNLGLQVLLSLEVDAFLDGSEADFTQHAHRMHRPRCGFRT